MPRPQQQQPPLSPPLVRPFARSLSFRSPIRVRFLSLSISPFRVSSLTWDEGKRESAKLPFSITDFLLSLSTLSLSVSSSSFFSSLFFSSSLSLSFFLSHHSSSIFQQKTRATFSLSRTFARSSISFFLFSRCLFSRALETARSFSRARLLSRTVANKCIECKLPTNFFLDSCLFALYMSVGMYISIRRHLFSAFS